MTTTTRPVVVGAGDQPSPEPPTDAPRVVNAESPGENLAFDHRHLPLENGRTTSHHVLGTLDLGGDSTIDVIESLSVAS